MSVEEALRICEEVSYDSSQKQRIVRGLNILAKYDDNLECQFEHDQIYCGDLASLEKMSKDEVRELAQCGWFIEEVLECWSHF